MVATHIRKTLYQKAFLPLTGRRQGSGLGNVVQIMEHEHSGRLKSEWAGNIARHLGSECTRSKSFQVFSTGSEIWREPGLIQPGIEIGRFHHEPGHRL